MPRRTGYKQVVRGRSRQWIRTATSAGLGMLVATFCASAGAQAPPGDAAPAPTEASPAPERPTAAPSSEEAPTGESPAGEPSRAELPGEEAAVSEPPATAPSAVDEPPARASGPDAEQEETERAPDPLGESVPPAPTTGDDDPTGDDEPADGGLQSAELDRTGTPPKPPRDGAPLPEEEWDDDYDGRPEPTRAEDVLIWIPRAPLYPVHLVLNYGVRAPVTGGITLAEKHKVFARVEDWLTFDDGKAGIYPVALYDAGRGFWGGLNFFYNDLGREGHSLRATAGFGSNDWILARIKDSWRIFEGGRGELTFSATFHRNPALAYTGIGPRTSIEDERFFREEKIEGAVDLRVALPNLNRFTMHAGFKRAKLGPGRSPSIADEDSPHSTDELTGFDDHFGLGRVGMKLELDTRTPRDIFIPGSGVRVASWGAYAYGPGQTRLSFFRYGSNPKLIWDITGANHVLTLGVYAEAVSKVGGDDVPLNELVALGGGEQLRGFLPGRFRGQSALVYSLDYSWPLLAFADAILFSEVGNAYGGFFRDFAHETMALDWGTGLRSSFSRELSLWFAVGFGTNQFDQWGPDRFRVDKTRVFVGATQRL